MTDHGPWPTVPTRAFGPDTKALIERINRVRAKQPAFMKPDPDESRTPSREAQWQAIVPYGLSGVSLHHCVPAYAAACEKWADSTTPNLLLQASNGVGKTVLAVATALWWWGPGRHVYWAPVAELIEASKPHATENQQALVRRLSSIGRNALVVLDDLGSHRGTDFADDVLYRTVNRLTERGVRLIVTTTLTPLERRDQWDAALRSRIESDGKPSYCRVIKLEGPDRRGEPLPLPPKAGSCHYPGCVNGFVAVEAPEWLDDLAGWPCPPDPPPLPPGRGVDGCWHGGPEPCPRDFGLAPEKRYANWDLDMRKWKMVRWGLDRDYFTIRPCPGCQPAEALALDVIQQAQFDL